MCALPAPLSDHTRSMVSMRRRSSAVHRAEAIEEDDEEEDDGEEDTSTPVVRKAVSADAMLRIMRATLRKRRGLAVHASTC